MIKNILFFVTISVFSIQSFAGGVHEVDSAVGEPGHANNVQREIKVNLSDTMRIKFDKELDEIKSGTTIKFVVENTGKIPHELFIGSEREQDDHAEMMKEMPEMKHDDANTLVLGPGQTGTIIWNFQGEELVVFACNIAGHFEAGMFKKVPIIK